jgi:hypothetical protein
MPFLNISSPKKPKPTDSTQKSVDAIKKTAAKPPSPNDAPIINPEADSILGRLTLQTMFVTFLVMILMMGIGIFGSRPGTAIFKYHRLIAIVTTLPILAVWYGLTGKLYSKRLEIGRDLLQKREFKQAIVCLEPFNAFGQRMLDRTGEAHYLLAQAYAGAGRKSDAEKCRKFVLDHRPGPWAEKLGGKPAPVKRTSPAAQEAIDAAKPKPPKSKPKRRF